MADKNQEVSPHILFETGLSTLRNQLAASLKDENVHASFDKVFAGISPAMHGAKPAGQPFTLRQILEHLRLCVLDFLDYCRIPGYIEPKFPEGYWPAKDAPIDETAWDRSLDEYQLGMRQMEALILDSSTDLFSPIPGGDGRNILRQVLATLDHNAYHLGQAVLLRKLLGEWNR